MDKSKHSNLIYQIVSAAFCVMVVVANIVSAKMVKMPFFQQISIPAGLVIYPLTFLLSNFVTEIYGKAQARLMVYMALAMNVLSLCIIQIALVLPADTLEGQTAFHAIMGLAGVRIFASLAAYVIAQIVDIQLYALIRNWTGMRFLWLRNNGATLLSQMVDTVVIDLIFLYWSLGMPLTQVLAIILFSYVYKVVFSLANTPLLYLFVSLINRSWKRVKITRPEAL